MEYLQNNFIRISKHKWQEEEWDLSVIFLHMYFLPVYQLIMRQNLLAKT
jgi:hypothetical protein